MCNDKFVNRKYSEAMRYLKKKKKKMAKQGLINFLPPYNYFIRGKSDLRNEMKFRHFALVQLLPLNKKT